MRKILCLLLAVLSLAYCSTAAAWGESNAEQYEKAMDLLKENKYAEAGQAFAALGSYADSPRYTMYCSAIAAGEAGFYSIAVTNLNSLSGFLDSDLLAVYYTGLSWEAAEDYEHASEVLSGISLYRDVASRLAGYPALINARDAAAAEQTRADAYAAADRAEQKGDYDTAYKGFTKLGEYKDSAARAAEIKRKINERNAAAEEQARADAYAAADLAQQKGDFAAAYTGFIKLGDYKDSTARAAAIQDKGKYAQALEYAMQGNYSAAYRAFDALGDYEDSAEKAYVLSVTTFATVEDRGNGIAAFQFHDSWGFLNVNSNTITSPLWDSIDQFNSAGLAKVSENSKYGYINAQGEVIVSCQWDDIDEFNILGLAKVSKNSKYGYVNVQGELVISCQWDGVSAFSGSLCTVCRNNSLGLVDSEGRIVSPAQWKTLGDSYTYNGWSKNTSYTYAPIFTDGKIKVQNSNGKWGFIDKDGNSVGEIVWDEIQRFSGGLAVVKKNNKFGLIDNNGQIVGEVVWDEIQSFSEGLAAVKKSNKYGFIDKNGQVVIQPQYTAVRSFREGLSAVKDGSRWKYIDVENNIVIPALYSEVRDFSKGKADVFLPGTGWQIIEKNGALVYFVSSETRNNYKLALNMEEAGELEQAVALFSSMNYKDSAEKARRLSYSLGKTKQKAQDWDGAIKAFELAGEYSDAAMQILETNYIHAEVLEESGDITEAIDIFNSMDYKDSVEKARRLSYSLGKTKQEAQDWDGAIKAFELAGEYSDAATQILETNYLHAVALTESGDITEAMAIFSSMNYRDSGERIKELLYMLGKIKQEAQDWDSAIKAFEQAGDYSDATTQILETNYLHAKVLAESGDFKGAVVILNTIKGYKDVDSLLKSTDYLLAVLAVEEEQKRSYYWTVGSTVTFGQYEQDNNFGNGKEPIEWIVLDVQDDKALLISRYALDGQQYFNMIKNITWENSTLRAWLNNDFCEIAFNSKEQSSILSVTVDNSKKQGYSKYNTDGGNDTQDKIFLLSYAEAWKYFKSDEARKCQQTKYAEAQNPYRSIDGYCWWWLRSPGKSQIRAAAVYTTGDIFDGSVGGSIAAVRPAMWVDLTAEILYQP